MPARLIRRWGWSLTLAAWPVLAQHQHQDLSALFYPDIVLSQQRACVRRLPATAPSWTEAVERWQREHRRALDALRELQTEVSTQAQGTGEPGAAPTEMQSHLYWSRVDARAAGKALSGQSEAQAQQTCAAWLERLGDARAVQADLAAARLTGGVALSACRTRP